MLRLSKSCSYKYLYAATYLSISYSVPTMADKNRACIYGEQKWFVFIGLLKYEFGSVVIQITNFGWGAGNPRKRP